MRIGCRAVGRLRAAATALLAFDRLCGEFERKTDSEREQGRPALFLLITVSGFINEWLRKDTTKPLEIVALPENVPPAVEQAVARAEVANIVAVKAAEQGAV